MTGGMILLRTMRLDTDSIDLAGTVNRASGLPVTMLADERKGPAGECAFPKIGMDMAAYRSLELYLPPDVGWLCGDYGLYLARRRFPGISHFWMIENDVRIEGDAPSFFAACGMRPEIDLLVARYRPSEPDWWWNATLAARDITPYRCFFPVVRMSAQAIDLLYAKRRRQSGIYSRRMAWPNDEGFVATTIAQSTLRAVDLNDVVTDCYDDETYTFEELIDGTALPETDGPKLFHPVLSGEYLVAKQQRLQRGWERSSLAERARRKAGRVLNSRLSW